MSVIDARKQARYDLLQAKFETGDITTLEVIEHTRLNFELHPELIYWTDGRTPAQMWPLPSDEQEEGQA